MRTTTNLQKSGTVSSTVQVRCSSTSSPFLFELDSSFVSISGSSGSFASSVINIVGRILLLFLNRFKGGVRDIDDEGLFAPKPVTLVRVIWNASAFVDRKRKRAAKANCCKRFAMVTNDRERLETDLFEKVERCVFDDNKMHSNIQQHCKATKISSRNHASIYRHHFWDHFSHLTD